MTCLGDLVMISFCMWIGAAVAGPFDRDAWEEVQLAEVDGGLLDGDHAWLKTDRGCVEAALDHGEDAWVRVPVCTVARGPSTVRCVDQRPLSTVWGLAFSTCTVETPGEPSRGWGATAGGSHTPERRLVEHTDAVATWRIALPAHARVEELVHERRPCLPGTAPEGGGAHRTCDVSKAMRPFVATEGRGMGLAALVVENAEPVDCGEPCPPNPVYERVRDLDEGYAGQWFAERGRIDVQLHATKAACEAGPARAVSTRGPDTCQSSSDPAHGEAP